MFFSFDGIDGGGKSTQMALFVTWLREQGRDVVTCRDPGSTPLGERLRGLLLTHDDTLLIDPRAEMLMYMAARAQLVEEVIRPALAAGKVVVSDRFVLANIVYQAYAGGLAVDEVRAVGAVTTAGVHPDLVFVLDVPLAVADERLGATRDRMEARDRSYRQRLCAGYAAEADRDPAHIKLVDATRTVDQIAAELRTLAAPLLR